MIKKTLTILLFILSTKLLISQVVVNEFSAANYDFFQDNYGEYEDWVELYNTSSSDIDLNGWYLSDKSTNITKWQFPSSYIISANSTALIYCSGRDELIGGIAHTNFKITQTKGNETFIIADATGAVIDSISVLPHQKSHSRGRDVNGGSNWSVFSDLVTTPGANNNGALLEYASTPSFSQPSGYYNTGVDIAINSPDPNVTIYYTVDGSMPDNTSLIYNSPVNITSTTVLKAVAYSSNPNIPRSFLEYNTYFINDTHTVSILSIAGTDLGDLLAGNQIEPQGTVEYFDSGGNLLDKGTGEYNKHGNDSWAYDQRGFDFIMRDQFGYNYAINDKIFETKNRDSFQKLIVKAAANDNFSFEDGAHIRDQYVHHLSQLADLRMDERSYAPCIVYLNGEYWGVYDLREKADDHDFTDYYYDQSKNNLQYLKTWGGTWSEYGGPQSQTDWDALKNYITTNPMTVQANYDYVKGIYNTGSIIDYFLLNSYVVASDWLNWNTAWWRGLDPNGDKKKWRYALWDMDATFDHYINYTGVPSTSPTADPCDPSSLNDPGGQGHVPIWNALLTNDDFFDDYINRWQDLANGPLSCSNMVGLLDSMIAIINPEMPRQINRWGGGTYNDWLGNVQDLRNFILARCDSMNTGFVPCYPALSGPHNISVEIIGIGEVEMSDGNIINNFNTPFIDQRFGGVNLPFEVKSGTFQNWEILPSGAYVYDPLTDTLSINIQGNVTIRANFIPPVPTRDIVYEVVPSGTNSKILADGNIINNYPTTINYVLGDTVTLATALDPLYGFSMWSGDSVAILPSTSNSNAGFYANHHDTIRLHTYLLPTITAFISGNDTLCSNQEEMAKVKISLGGIAPFNFIYSINGVSQSQITTNNSPYIINTNQAGLYELISFSDAYESGNLSGQAYVTIVQAPNAEFIPEPDTMTILYTSTKMLDISSGDINSWVWNFGDGSPISYSSSPFHTYLDSIANYQISLVVKDVSGCRDSTSRIVTIRDDFWIYIPNSFTPDSDDLNDKFQISYHGIREETFIINIFNRQNEVVYSTEDIFDLDSNNGWDGNHQTKNFPLPGGIYVYELYFQDFDGWKNQKNGYINIIR